MQLARVLRMTTLRSLILDRSDVTLERSCVSEPLYLRKLKLSSSNIDLECLAYITSLESLMIIGIEVANEHLLPLTNLRELNLIHVGTSVTSEALLSLPLLSRMNNKVAGNDEYLDQRKQCVSRKRLEWVT